MRARGVAAAAMLALAAAAPAAPQEVEGSGAKPKGAQGSRVTPLSLATSLAFPATFWTAIGVSSAATAPELGKLQQKGYYRLELLQVVLLAARSGEPLSKVTEERDKGTALRDLAAQRRLDYDALYEDSLALDLRVASILPRVLSVSVSTEPVKGPAPAGPPASVKPRPPPGSRPRRGPGPRQPRPREALPGLPAPGEAPSPGEPP